MRNAMQLKAIINNIAKEKGIRPQLALQNYMLELFLERVSLSRYRDNFILAKVQAQNINIPLLRIALNATAEKRGTISAIEKYEEIMSVVRDSSIMKERWEAYRKDFNYASDIEFNEVCDAVLWIMRCISA